MRSVLIALTLVTLATNASASSDADLARKELVADVAVTQSVQTVTCTAARAAADLRTPHWGDAIACLFKKRNLDKIDD